jgi:hypothetical protein
MRTKRALAATAQASPVSFGQYTDRTPMSSLTAHRLPMAIGAKSTPLVCCCKLEVDTRRANTIPYYLTEHYTWAYVHPMAVKFFERQWLVNLLLWGNYARLRDAALSELGETLSGNTLQIACVYGDLTNRLSGNAERAGGSVDVVDVLPVQLRNLRGKLPKTAPVRLFAMDAAALDLPDASYENCHGGGVRRRQHSLRLDPALELLV